MNAILETVKLIKGWDLSINKAGDVFCKLPVNGSFRAVAVPSEGLSNRICYDFSQREIFVTDKQIRAAIRIVRGELDLNQANT